jgi:murein DD-endopeptidase MepM/ murein hydrolase activator NlpD
LSALALLSAVGAGLAIGWASGGLDGAWWWLTNTNPPSIEANLPSGPLRATLEAPVAVLPLGRAALTAARLDGLPVELGGAASDPPLAIDTTRLPDGDHALHLEAADTSLRRNRTTLDLRFRSDNTPPTITLDGVPPTIRAGQPAALRLTPSEPAVLQAEWEGQPLPLIATAGPPLALIAVPATRPGGPGTLTVHTRDVAGNTRDDAFSIAIESVTLPRQVLLVPATLAALATGPVASAEATQLDALTRGVRPERLWDGEFRAPLTGLRTTGFGDRRDYADGYVAAHAGYDVAAPERTPVQAVANGIVVFAGPLQQRGTTLILNHGWGVYSLYGHLSEFRVQPGDRVERGQTVGLVGSTGLSTGPHLHWEIRLRGQPVDPDAWIALSKTLP